MIRNAFIIDIYKSYGDAYGLGPHPSSDWIRLDLTEIIKQYLQFVRRRQIVPLFVLQFENSVQNEFVDSAESQRSRKQFHASQNNFVQIEFEAKVHFINAFFIGRTFHR